MIYPVDHVLAHKLHNKGGKTRNPCHKGWSSDHNKRERKMTQLITWLNTDEDTIVLQRDNAFAMLTWRDFNREPELGLTLQTATLLFILTAGIPLLFLS